jgi:biopolymer transport protein ExbB
MFLGSILLQINESGTKVAEDTSKVVHESIPVFSLIFKGGVVVIPIFLLLILALFIMFQKFLQIHNAAKISDSFTSKLNQLILNGEVKEAKVLCASTESPIASMLGKGVSRIGRPIKDIESAMENTAKLEIGKLEKNLGILSIVSGIAPMFGFIGTIIGVISIFYEISLQGEISIGGVADGLYQKMVTSAAGLIVGIVSHVGYHLVNLRLESVIRKMEVAAIEFLDLLQDSK